MILQSAREELISIAKKALDTKLTVGTGGNFSICDRESGVMAITPSGVDYYSITPDQIVLIDVQTGRITDNPRNSVPSSECDMHRIFYKYRTDINALVHTHTAFAATIACMNWDLPALHYLVAFGGGKDVRCAKYATYGTVALARNAFEAMKDRKACLLANHGMLTGGATLGEALAITEQLEFCCQLYYRTRCIGEPVVLSDEEMERMVGRFANYGKRIEEHEEI